MAGGCGQVYIEEASEAIRRLSLKSEGLPVIR